MGIDVKVTPFYNDVNPKLGKLIGATMPRYMRIEFCGDIIHLDQDFKVMVGCNIIPEDELPYTSDGEAFGGKCAFTIEKQIVTTNGIQPFLVLKSDSCGLHAGFEGDGLNSVAVIKRPCNPHGGKMTGLCGDCNGIADDLRTCPDAEDNYTQQDKSQEEDPFSPVVESCRADDSMDAWEETFNPEAHEYTGMNKMCEKEPRRTIRYSQKIMRPSLSLKTLNHKNKTTITYV